MYQKNSGRHSVGCPSILPTAAPDCTREYHPLSYYVLGGVDVTGDGLDLSAPVSFETKDDIDKGVEPDSRCNPRVSFFDIVEGVGVAAAENAEQSKQ